MPRLRLRATSRRLFREGHMGEPEAMQATSTYASFLSQNEDAMLSPKYATVTAKNSGGPSIAPPRATTMSTPSKTFATGMGTRPEAMGRWRFTG